jgi:4-diphosphocytidyl-2-C-methyl-D-erythritol kinase
MTAAATTRPLGQELARAKVNLSLRVLGRRPDGYHVLESVVMFADVADWLTLRAAQAWSVTVSGPFAGVLEGENLVDRAAATVAAAIGHPLAFALDLDKQLPVAAGLGGGSADAAATLRLLRRVLGAEARLVDWTAVAASLGADVPVCVADQAAVMGGIGDRLVPLVERPILDAVLVTPRIEVPARKTAAIFQALGAGPVTAADAARLPRPPLDLEAHLATSGNDLQPAALAVMPAIGEVLEQVGGQTGARHTRLSGAGPSVLALFATADAAAAAARHLQALRPRDWVVATKLR